MNTSIGDAIIIIFILSKLDRKTENILLNNAISKNYANKYEFVLKKIKICGLENVNGTILTSILVRIVFYSVFLGKRLRKIKLDFILK